jgi:membrane-bound lytic murein transglycosylase D
MLRTRAVRHTMGLLARIGGAAFALTLVSAAPLARVAAQSTRDSAARALPPAPPSDATPVAAVDSAPAVADDTIRAVAADTARTVAVDPGPVYDIDVRSYETHARVQHFVGLFSGKVRDEFAKSLQRQTRYGAIIRKKLRQGGLPEDMTYLALVESWYDPNAFSKAAAVGIWQFMAGTGRGVGLRVDWWVDERRDPVRSTEGAVKLLAGLRSQFGSLYLAAAAYDGGDGRVSRGLVRNADRMDGIEGEDRFFSLAATKFLRPETRDYVPKIIAAALVGKEPSRYGVTVDSLPPLLYDTVRVPGEVPLAAIARATDTTANAVHELNFQLLRGMTPPGDSIWVRVPAGTGAAFAERFAAIDPDERAGVTRVRSKKGESMFSIAHAHGLTTKQLAWYNPRVSRLKSGNLVAGQMILVPSPATVAAAADVPNPLLERYPHHAKASARHKAVAAAAKKPAEPPARKVAQH